MPIELDDPKVSVELRKAKVASFKVEDNVERWVKIWVVYLREVDGELIPYQDPETGKEALEFKIENGFNPLRDGQALGKCSVCGKWHRKASGPCEEEGCEGSVSPYDGLTRLIVEPSYVGPPLSRRDDTKKALYDFLTTEEVLHPDTEEVAVLLAGVQE